MGAQAACIKGLACEQKHEEGKGRQRAELQAEETASAEAHRWHRPDVLEEDKQIRMWLSEVKQEENQT